MITLNRPGARNAINGALRNELNGAWDRFRDEEDVWVAILTANGDVLCTGADLNDSAVSSPRLHQGDSCTARVMKA